MCRFEKALHPDVKRGEAGAAWIKSFTGQLEDPDYVLLTQAERGLLHDLRLMAARRKNKLPLDAERIGAMVRAGRSASRIAPMLDKLARLDFIERTDEQPWAPLHQPVERPSRNATRDSSKQIASANADEKTADADEIPANVTFLHAESKHDADAEEKEREKKPKEPQYVGGEQAKKDDARAEREAAARFAGMDTLGGTLEAFLDRFHEEAASG